ncbi:helix-turn-helix domain-containing protein [Culicoidibacter larvae]|uniref:Helix-turn-helix transcriptional regulator n=1 Tax=Culicoidibacter larvae TaxID=2579976 RepID=A0A5R8Q6Q0_9FIRM|nr:helix-turn-helix domain-containing protein [Culicoidibacter larvae]TLG70263.1 helix-turn-helix transcriptional regulator [Culicoidibacter larvae]
MKEKKKKQTGLSLGEAIKYFRELKGFKMTDLVARMNPQISTTTLQNIENGNTKDPAFSKIIDILDILGFELEDLRYAMSNDIETEALNLLYECQYYGRQNDFKSVLLILPKITEEMIAKLSSTQKQQYYIYKSYALFKDHNIKEAKRVLTFAQAFTALKDSPIITFQEAKIYNYKAMFGFDGALDELKSIVEQVLDSKFFDNSADHSLAVLLLINAICYLNYFSLKSNFKSTGKYSLEICDDLYKYADKGYKRAREHMNFKFFPTLITFRSVSAYLRQNNDITELEDIKRARRLAKDLELEDEIDEINEILDNLKIRI